MPYSWREGCPVPVSDLRLATVSFWGFDSKVRRGELVVHQDQAAGVVSVMQKLFDERFPIDKMELIDNYQADDDKSVEANNTSAFNCRKVAGSDVWSEHSYGRALDINPVQNPFVTRSGEVESPRGKPFADRTDRRMGMILGNGIVVKAFRSIGWSWGGSWTNSKDYQHFSATGR
ncbi:MAG: M15 family metallopeptidase [Actinomycetota bacterium]